MVCQKNSKVKFQDRKILFSDGEEIPEEGECFTRDDYKYLEKLVRGTKYIDLLGTRPKIRIQLTFFIKGGTLELLM